MTLTARDEANNEGTSAPHEFRLPQRIFVEAARPRRHRAAARPRARCRQPRPGADRTRRARHRAGAVHARDGHLSRTALALLDTLRKPRPTTACATSSKPCGISPPCSRRATCPTPRRALRNAQEALRQALEQGATDEEIKKLTDELRAALNQFLQALAEEMRKNPQMARPLDPEFAPAPQPGSAEHDRPHGAARALRRQGCRQAVAGPVAADAGKPADGAPRPVARTATTT